MKDTRIIFMGTPEFALPAITNVHDNFNIVGVFTQPDKANQRGHKVKFSPIKEFALEHDLPIYQPINLKSEEIADTISSLEPDVIVVVAYGQILPKRIIDIPKYGTINVHPSLLPKYRGAAPMNVAIINGDTETGVCIMNVDVALDAGDILACEHVPITDDDNLESMHDKLSIIGSYLLVDTINNLVAGTITPIPQDDRLATVVKQFSKDDLKIDWKKTERQIFNFVRGLDPFPCSVTTLDGSILKVYRVEENHKVYENAEIGQVVDIIKKKGPVVKVSDGSVVITKAKPENKKVLTGSDLINGNLISLGDKLI